MPTKKKYTLLPNGLQKSKYPTTIGLIFKRRERLKKKKSKMLCYFRGQELSRGGLRVEAKGKASKEEGG